MKQIYKIKVTVKEARILSVLFHTRCSIIHKHAAFNNFDNTTILLMIRYRQYRELQTRAYKIGQLESDSGEIVIKPEILPFIFNDLVSRRVEYLNYCYSMLKGAKNPFFKMRAYIYLDASYHCGTLIQKLGSL
jgi:hypothetical protein